MSDKMRAFISDPIFLFKSKEKLSSESIRGKTTIQLR